MILYSSIKTSIHILGCHTSFTYTCFLKMWDYLMQVFTFFAVSSILYPFSTLYQTPQQQGQWGGLSQVLASLILLGKCVLCVASCIHRRPVSLPAQTTRSGWRDTRPQGPHCRHWPHMSSLGQLQGALYLSALHSCF